MFLNAEARQWFRVRRGVGAIATLALGFILLGAQSPPAQKPPSKPPTFETDIVPILTKSTCLGCHGPSLKMKELNLSTYKTALQGSESGPVIVPGKPDDSRLYHMVKEGLMPPGGKVHLSDGELATIREWIESGAGSATASHAEAELSKVTQDDVIPIMLLRCVACHGARMQEGGLDLRTRESMLKGGKSGPAMVLGKPDESLLLKMIRSGDMPPKKRLIVVGVKPVADAEAAKIARWIELGAPVVAEPPDVAATEADPLVSDKDRSFWSFQPPKAAEPPAVKHADRVRNPIDAFLLSKLEAKGLSFSPEADKITLMRRVYFDLIGLPPEPAEIQAYMADKSPDAYEKLVDRLLASPHYGERWGRYWLDAAGYADSEGGKLSADHPRPYAWRYRDYVIQSFNADKSYDRFLTEQIAGDELVDYEHASTVTKQMMDNLIATGFLRMAPDSTSEREVNFSDDRLDVVADEIDVFSSTVLGLTMKCAHCHSHKYDPIPQRDYYRLDAVLKGAYDEHDWLQPLYIPKTTVITNQTQGRMLPYVEPGKTPYELAEDARNREDFNAEIDRQLGLMKSAWEQKIGPLKKKVLDERLTQTAQIAPGRSPRGCRGEARRAHRSSEVSGRKVRRHFESFLRRSQGRRSGLRETRREVPERKLPAAGQENCRSENPSAVGPWRALANLYIAARQPVELRAFGSAGCAGGAHHGSQALRGQATLAGRVQDRAAARAGELARPAESSTDLAGHGESHLGAAFRRRHRHYSRKFRPHRRGAHQSGVAGLAGRGIRQAKLEHQSHAPPDDDFHRVPAKFCSDAGIGAGRPR